MTRKGPHLVRLSGGFTLVEMMISTTVLAILILLMVTALDGVQRSWSLSKAKVEQFRSARTAFETITRNVSQATLNTYWDYHYQATQSNVPPEKGAAVPAGYVRQSELQFWIGSSVSLGGTNSTPATHPGHSIFFQAPLGQSESYDGLPSLLNAAGYYVQFGDNQSRRPHFLPAGTVSPKSRYRLMEYRPPAEAVTINNKAYQGNTVYSKKATWYKEDLASASRALADDILLLVFSPQVPEETLTSPTQKASWIAPAYRYDSRDADNATEKLDGVTIGTDDQVKQGTQHLLPPQIRITMIAADEASMARWMDARQQAPFDFQKEADAPFTQVSLYDRDLQRVKDKLASERLNYRVFTSVISLRNAVWDSRTY